LASLISAAASELSAAFPSLGGGLGGTLTAESRAGGGPGEPPRTWAAWRSLLESARAQARQRLLQARHSEETVRKILEGLEIIRRSDGRYSKEEVVAARVGLSRSYFSRCFKDITGVEFKKFLIDKSIAEAKDFLVHTTEPFRSISARLGYQNEAHFSRTFRSLTGLTPREFRTQHPAAPNQSPGDRH
jgi:two-component system response regulator YesN